MTDERKCHYCGLPDTGERRKKGDGRSAELRPYGPGGAWVCFDCAFSTPERKASTEGAFSSLLEGNAAIAPQGVVAIGETTGPRPFDLREAGRCD